MSLCLVRHAEAAWPVGAALGHADPGLSLEGVRTAEALAARFATERFDRIIASDLIRARVTAEWIARGRGLEVEVWAELREVDFGAWEGCRLSDLWLLDPTCAARWEADVRCFPAGFGETFGAFEQRIGVACERLRSLSPHGVVVVSHGGTMRMLQVQLGAIPLQRAWAEQLAPGDIREIAWAAVGAPLINGGPA